MNLGEALAPLGAGQAAAVDPRDPAHRLDMAPPDSAVLDIVTVSLLKLIDRLPLHRLRHEEITRTGGLALRQGWPRRQARSQRDRRDTSYKRHHAACGAVERVSSA